MPVDAAALAFVPAAADDVDLLAELNQGLARDEGSDIAEAGFAAFRDRMAGFLAGDYEGTIFRDGERVAGYALYRREDELYYLRQFYICPEFRGQGLGRACFERLRREVFPPELELSLSVLATNPNGAAFWAALGLKPHHTNLRLPPLRPDG